MKKIEIIIVNDNSIDKSKVIFQYLIKEDETIRIYNHLKYILVWFSRLDAFLSSNAPHVIHFYTGVLY